MEVYLLRHGLAEERGRDGQADEDRALTRKGAKKVRIMGRWMKAQGIELDLFLTSPLLRARQTLEVIQEFYPHVPVRISKGLVPEGSPRSAAQALARSGKKHKRILIAGHEPLLGKLAAYLLTGNISAGIEFKKAGLCKMAVPGAGQSGPAVLHWLTSPKLIEAAA